MSWQVVWEKFAASKRGRNAEPPCAADGTGSSSGVGWSRRRSRAPPGWHCWVWVGTAGPWDHPNSAVSPDIYYIFCLGFVFWVFFFQLWKSLDAVGEGWEGRCPCLVVLAALKPTGLQALPALPWELLPVPVGPSRLAGAWRHKGQVPMSPVTQFTCRSLEPFAALTSDVSSMIYAPVWTLLYIRVGVLHSHLLSIFLCALSDGFADCISIVFISMQVFKQYLTTVFLKTKLHKG